MGELVESIRSYGASLLAFLLWPLDSKNDRPPRATESDATLLINGILTLVLSFIVFDVFYLRRLPSQAEILRSLVTGLILIFIGAFVVHSKLRTKFKELSPYSSATIVLLSVPLSYLIASVIGFCIYSLVYSALRLLGEPSPEGASQLAGVGSTWIAKPFVIGALFTKALSNDDMPRRLRSMLLGSMAGLYLVADFVYFTVALAPPEPPSAMQASPHSRGDLVAHYYAHRPRSPVSNPSPPLTNASPP